jgi:Pyruvate/2-oxoacid:ferredoxin oxidoreductase delta subunit
VKADKIQLPVIDISKCTMCDKCIDNCPKESICKVSSSACAKCIKYCIAMKVPCNPNSYVFCYEQCDQCGLCVSVCDNAAIYWFKVIQ